MAVEEETFKSRFDDRILLRILAQARPRWQALVGFVLATLVVTFLDNTWPYLNKRIVDEGIVPGDRDVLVRLVVTYGVLIVVHSVAVYAHNFLTEMLGHLVRYDLRKKLFDHVHELSFSYFDRTPVGWIVARVTSDSEQIAELVSWGLLNVTWVSTRLITALYYMLLINWRLALVVFTTVPVLWLVSLSFRQRIIGAFRGVRQVNSRITGSFNENITGVRAVKALGLEEENLQRFNELAGEMYTSSYRATWLSALFQPAVQLIGAMAVGAIAWYGGWQTHLGVLTIGSIQAFVSYAYSLLWPMDRLSRTYADTQHAIASAERIFSLLDRAPEIADQPGTVDPGTIRGDIVFDHVDFWYEPDNPVLQNFSLEVKQGEAVALVGPTGGGKSTIVNLLCRFYEPKAGTIYIGGQDYTRLNLRAIQAQIGMVPQTPYLFSGMIRENIRYGRLDATDEEVEQAAKQARAHDFIITLEKEYDEEVGEGGVLLSVGQKQLISLARVILARPEIFIMDEATSSVDTLTEVLIQKGMETLMRNRTSFIIAHRLSTIKRADRILFIEDGRIVEGGSHTELLRARGRYYRLYTAQFRHELEQKYRVLESPAPVAA